MQPIRTRTNRGAVSTLRLTAMSFKTQLAVFPLELLEQILEFCNFDSDDIHLNDAGAEAVDRDPLINCSRVSRTFYDLSQRLRYREIEVNEATYSKWSQDLSSNFLIPRTTKAHLTKTLHIKGADSGEHAFKLGPDWLNSILAHDFKNVKALSLRDLTLYDLSEASQQRLSILVRQASLRRLELALIDASEALLYHLPLDLQHLSMSEVGLYSAADVEVSVARPVLRSLALAGWCTSDPSVEAPSSHVRQADYLVDWFVELESGPPLPFDLSQLTSFSLNEENLEPGMFMNESLNHTLQRWSATLKHLKLNASFEEWSPINLNLGEHAALSTLHIHFPEITQDLLEWLTQKLKTLPASTSLRTITISTCLFPTRSPGELDWKSLCKVATKLGTLRHFEVVLLEPEAFDEDEERNSGSSRKVPKEAAICGPLQRQLESGLEASTKLSIRWQYDPGTDELSSRFKL
ncbi:hypothetical protein DXG01_009121 [Tephrocybe rancida]|nr:hypothetical protein DXG01_009121 [Tephrocybe rancida]